jgi:hypothetical protein
MAHAPIYAARGEVCQWRECQRCLELAQSEVAATSVVQPKGSSFTIEPPFQRGYPQDNIIFEDSREAIILAIW